MNRWACAWTAVCLCGGTAAWGEQTQGTAGGTRSANARLDFQVNIDRMLFFRVGAGGSHGGVTSGIGPAASGTVSTVGFSLAPAVIPGSGATATDGNNRAAGWNGAAPTFASPSDVVLPVEVRSNAGAVRITAQTATSLTNGGFIIPMSEISVTSSDSGALPAPPITDAGVGTAVNVSVGGTGTGASPTRLTYRTADWTFRYTPVTVPVAGVYTGQITFTASAP